MAELLLRGWNAAIPEVDTGDDIFVVHDVDGQLVRVQVKTANVNAASGRDTALFNISNDQLLRPILPALVFVFAIRRTAAWDAFITLRQSDLRAVVDQIHMAPTADGRMLLRLDVAGERITCAGADLSRFRNSWEPFPFRDWPALAPDDP